MSKTSKTYAGIIRVTATEDAFSISHIWAAAGLQGPVTLTDRDKAREFGTFILFCTGNESLWTNEDYVVSDGTHEVRFAAEDGVPLFVIADSSSPIQLPEADAIDLGQRLIIWAGIA